LVVPLTVQHENIDAQKGRLAVNIDDGVPTLHVGAVAIRPIESWFHFVMHDGSPMQPEVLNRVFRENLRRRRTDLQLSQAALAERLTGLGDRQVAAPYISDLETGKRVPVIGSLARLAEALETTPEFLIATELSRTEEA